MGRRHRKRTGMDWRGRDTGIPNGEERRRYVNQLGDQLRGTVREPAPHPLDIPPSGRAWFRTGADEPWQDLGIVVGPIEFRSDEVLRVPDFREIQEQFVRQHRQSMDQMRQAFNRMAEIMREIPQPPPQPEWSPVPGFDVAGAELPVFQVERGGIRWGEAGWRPTWRTTDPRQGEEVYVNDLLPGARVYVLEDVFTVDRVDMDAPLPTVWLKELPTSPLYFSEDESIYLANEKD